MIIEDIFFFTSFLVYTVSLLVISNKTICNCHQVSEPIAFIDYIGLFFGISFLILSRNNLTKRDNLRQEVEK